MTANVKAFQLSLVLLYYQISARGLVWASLAEDCTDLVPKVELVILKHAHVQTPGFGRSRSRSDAWKKYDKAKNRWAVYI